MKKFVNTFLLVVCLALTSAVAWGQTTYYSSASGIFATLTNWNTQRDGSGSVPGTISGNSFVIQNGYSMTNLSPVTIEDLTVESGGTLTCTNGSDISGTTFTLASGGTLGIGSTAGITLSEASGSIQTTTRSFSTDANYNYAGTGGVQNTGNGLPSSVNNLRVFNASGVTLDSNTTVNGTLMLDGGTFTVGANTLTLTNPISGTATNLFANSNSSITISGSVAGINIPGSVSALRNVTINNASGSTMQGPLTIYGTLTITDGIFDDGGNQITIGEVSALNVGATGTLKLGSDATATTFPWFSSTTLAPGSTVQYAAGVPQTVSTVPNYADLFLWGGTKIVAEGTLTISEDWYVGANTDFSNNNPPVYLTGNLRTGIPTVTVTMGADNIYIGGNISGDPLVFQGGSGAVVFNGTGQSVGVTNGVSFNNVAINDSGGVTLLSGVTINGALTLAWGKINTSNSNMLTLASTASVNGGSSSSFVNGPMTYAADPSGNITKVFPIGKGSAYCPVTLTVVEDALIASSYSAEVFNTAPTTRTLAAGHDKVSNVRYWSLTGGGGVVTAAIEITYGIDDGVTDASNLRIAKYNGGESSGWQDLGGIGSGNTSGTITSTNNFTNTGEFVLANATGGTNSLPVQLAKFSAAANRLSAELRWSTATEINNIGFDVERRAITNQLSANSSDLVASSWQKMGFVAGAGTSTSPKEYLFVDAQVPASRYAYRIKQINKDATFHYSASVEVEVGLAPKALTLSENYPNPFNPSTTIEFTVPNDGKVVLKVYNELGQEVAELFNGDATAGRIHQATFDARTLASGLYVTRMVFDGKEHMLKKMLLLK